MIGFIESSRVLIKQDPEKEGIIELRKGLDELSLGDRKYGQVRIRVGNGSAYIKGMAVYSDNIPARYDVVFYISDEFNEGGRIRGWGVDTKHELKKPLTIIEPEGDWKKWSESLEKSPHLTSAFTVRGPSFVYKEKGETK
jgi:hypothetical protein